MLGAGILSMSIAFLSGLIIEGALAVAFHMITSELFEEAYRRRVEELINRILAFKRMQKAFKDFEKAFASDELLASQLDDAYLDIYEEGDIDAGTYKVYFPLQVRYLCHSINYADVSWTYLGNHYHIYVNERTHVNFKHNHYFVFDVARIKQIINDDELYNKVVKNSLKVMRTFYNFFAQKTICIANKNYKGEYAYPYINCYPSSCRTLPKLKTAVFINPRSRKLRIYYPDFVANEGLIIPRLRRRYFERVVNIDKAFFEYLLNYYKKYKKSFFMHIELFAYLSKRVTSYEEYKGDLVCDWESGDCVCLHASFEYSYASASLRFNITKNIYDKNFVAYPQTSCSCKLWYISSHDNEICKDKEGFNFRPYSYCQHPADSYYLYIPLVWYVASPPKHIFTFFLPVLKYSYTRVRYYSPDASKIKNVFTALNCLSVGYNVKFFPAIQLIFDNENKLLEFINSDSKRAVKPDNFEPYRSSPQSPQHGTFEKPSFSPPLMPRFDFIVKFFRTHAYIQV